MHEVAAMRGAVRTALDYLQRSGGTRVTGVELVLGASGHLTEEAARQHFALFAANTPAADATVTIIWRPATYQCFACLHRFHSAQPVESVVCPTCGGVALEIEHEDTCYLHSIDVSMDDGPDDPGATPTGEVNLFIAT